MGNINTNFTERVRYSLLHKQYGSMVIQDPEGWDSDEKEIARNEDYHGIYTSFSNSLKFVGNGREYIKAVRSIYGVNADIRLTKEEMHPQTDLWVKSYDGYLDLSTYECEDNKVSIKFNSGGLEQILRTRETEDVELDRETTMDGNVIPALVPDKMQFDGRRIFLQSKWQTNPDENSVGLNIFVGTDEDPGGTGQSTAVPLELIQKSHEEAQSTSYGIYWNDSNADVAGLVIAESLENRYVRVYGTLKFKVSGFAILEGGLVQLLVLLSNHAPAPYPMYDSFPVYQHLVNPSIGAYHQISFDRMITIPKGTSLGFTFTLLGDDAIANMGITDIDCDLNIDEDSLFEKSISNIVLVHDICERLCNIISNQTKVFYSEYFGRTDLGYAKNGIGAFVGATNGFWIRGFDKLPLPTRTSPNLYKPFTTSFKDTIDSLNAIFNVGLGIERRGYNERIVVEDMKYFYNQTVTIKLPNQVSKVKRSEAAKYYYSGVEVGYEKGGVYEEAMGLDEYNAKMTMTSCITRLKQTYTKISKWRADEYGAEFARRKPRFRWATLDTSYDNDIFIQDLKPDASTIYKQRIWQDDFAQEPTGVYDPKSAKSLRFSPFNMMLRHGWIIAAGLSKYMTDYLRYASSTANSQLTTWLRTDAQYLPDTSATPGNGHAYSENGNIINSELKRARYIPEFVEFDHDVDFNIMQQIEGITKIGGKEIYNKYGLIQYINEDGNIEKGFLMNLKPNDGKWKILLFNH